MRQTQYATRPNWVNSICGKLNMLLGLIEWTRYATRPNIVNSIRGKLDMRERTGQKKVDIDSISSFLIVLGILWLSSTTLWLSSATLWLSSTTLWLSSTTLWLSSLLLSRTLVFLRTGQFFSTSPAKVNIPIVLGLTPRLILGRVRSSLVYTNSYNTPLPKLLFTTL
jgi:hypothetical protein